METAQKTDYSLLIKPLHFGAYLSLPMEVCVWQRSDAVCIRVGGISVPRTVTQTIINRWWFFSWSFSSWGWSCMPAGGRSGIFPFPASFHSWHCMLLQRMLYWGYYF